ncbi:MAG TPA: pyridoxine 5'-phosphate synthase [Gammaproteobacteria bacterium]|nr:pyridoxine 5'-phosphate synthase [Gammaproteobacteria bacterium]
MSSAAAIELTVVVDSVLRMREQQLWPHPDVLEFAMAAERAGVDGVLLSLHIQHVTVNDRDWRLLEGLHHARVCLAVPPDGQLLQAVAASHAARCVLVPGTRHQHSSGGALATGIVADSLLRARETFNGTNIELAARIDPDIEALSVCSDAGLDAVEINTAAYALASRAEIRARRLDELQACIGAAHACGLRVSVRGGLDFDNVGALTAFAQISEIRVGQALLARALLEGISASIARMRTVLGD